MNMHTGTVVVQCMSKYKSKYEYLIHTVIKRSFFDVDF